MEMSCPFAFRNLTRYKSGAFVSLLKWVRLSDPRHQAHRQRNYVPFTVGKGILRTS